MQHETKQDEGKASQPPGSQPFSRSYVDPSGKLTFEFHIGDDGVAYGKPCGFEDAVAANGLREIFLEARAHVGGSFPACFDISELEEVDPPARKIWSSTAFSKESPFSRVAIFGGGFFIRSLMNFYARISNIPVRMFKDREEAVAWSREGQS